jgi:hypothetical protein
LPFIRDVVSGERNLRGASQHPNEALIHFGSPENTMSTSYDGRILDHLAGYMLYLSTAPSFWFSLNSSHERGFDYKCIMIAANMAEFHRKFGFNNKLTLLNAFLNGHQFCASSGMVPFEVAINRMDYNAFINGTKPTKDRVKSHMIGIGVLDDHSPQKVEMQKDNYG